MAAVCQQGSVPNAQDTQVRAQFLQVPESNYPNISLTHQSRSISETVSLDFNIATVTGSSSRPGSSLAFRIVGGNTDDTFTVTSSGQIRLRKAPDYELARSYTLWLEVRDVAVSPALSRYAAINVDIQDANDNAPVFERTYYNASLFELQGEGVVVTAVTATDDDSDDNGRVSYDIIEGNDGGWFGIDASGDITTLSDIDREVQDKYQLVIRAVDHVSVSKNSLD